MSELFLLISISSKWSTYNRLQDKVDGAIIDDSVITTREFKSPHSESLLFWQHLEIWLTCVWCHLHSNHASDLLSDLTVGKPNWCIHARVLHQWDHVIVPWLMRCQSLSTSTRYCLPFESFKHLTGGHPRSLAVVVYATWSGGRYSPV